MSADVDSPIANDAARRKQATGPRRDRQTAPTRPAQPLIARPRLIRELGASLTRRLTVVLADAGYGKSVLLGAWAATVACVWYTVGPDDSSLASFVLGLAQAVDSRLPALSDKLRLVVQTSLGPDGDELERAGVIATTICEAFEQELQDDLVLVLDDVHELGRRGPSVRLLEGICRQGPARLHVVLSSRLEPPFPIQRLRGRGEVLDLEAATLAFREEEVAELLATTLGADAEALAPAVSELTSGWPAAVRLTVEALRPLPAGERAAALGALHRPGGRLFEYVAEEVFARAAPGVRQLLRRVAPFERFTVGFCKAIGVSAAAESVVTLRRAGLLLEPRGSEGDWLALHALVHEFVREHWPLNERERADVHTRAAAWFEGHGCQEEALASLLAVGDVTGAARVLETYGAQLLARGKVEATIRAAARLPETLRTTGIERLLGEAHEVRGEWDEALRHFERAAPDGTRLDAGLAWRLGLIHHLRGQLDEALEVYERGHLDTEEPRDAALLLAWRAAAYWLRGDVEACRTSAEEAFSYARTAGDPRALAAAHNALAMLAALFGDRLSNDAHYVRALDYAEQAGDVLQAIRVRTNRGSRHLEEGEYEQALAELEIATRLADLTGFVFFRALALTNRGEVHLRVGRLEEAIVDLETAKALYQRAGSRMVSYPLALLGEVHQERGDVAMAQAFYEDALARAEESGGDLQGLVPALAALASLLAADDPERARALAQRALGFGEGMAHVAALLAAGWVALTAGECEEALARAEQAAAAARLRRDRAGLAQSLELAALASTDQRRRTVRFEEAITLWRGVGHPLGEARAELLLALTTGGAAGAARAEEAERRLRAAGAHGYRALLASVLPSLLPAAGKPLEITTLGRFGVARAGRPVGRDEWQSKKARDLLKLLVARRGRATPRALLMEALWPDEDPALLSNRLSVALSTLRSVLDPDHRHAPDYFVTASGDAVGLARADTDVDVETFLEEGERALALYRSGRPEEGRPHLEAAEARYVGDFLEEDVYEDWTVPLREQARATYLAIADALAELAELAGDHDAAIRYRLRLLERDPYDERAHLGVARSLVAVGRHGEARRAYRQYVNRMTEIGIEAAPFPDRTRHEAAAATQPGRESSTVQSGPGRGRRRR